MDQGDQAEADDQDQQALGGLEHRDAPYTGDRQAGGRHALTGMFVARMVTTE